MIIAINAVLAALVVVGMLALLGSAIHTSRPAVAVTRRRRQRTRARRTRGLVAARPWA
jgi:hypothetical protein